MAHHPVGCASVRIEAHAWCLEQTSGWRGTAMLF